MFPRPHPAVGLGCFLVFAVAVASAAPPLVLAGAVMLVAAGACARALPAGGWRLLRRLRWLLLALAVTHLWATPGPPCLASAPGWSPSCEGLALALRRALALIELAVAGGYVLTGYSREELVGALHLLAAPLDRYGRLRERMTARLALTLAVVPRLAAVLEARPRTGGQPLRRAAATAAWAWRVTVAEAARAADTGIDVARLPVPPRTAWLLPLLLAAVFAAAGCGAG